MRAFLHLLSWIWVAAAVLNALVGNGSQRANLWVVVYLTLAVSAKMLAERIGR